MIFLKRSAQEKEISTSPNSDKEISVCSIDGI
jgi:hypothetical protein